MITTRHFRDTARWLRPGGEPEYPGHIPEGQEETIPVRDVGASIVQIGGDNVHRRVWWTLSEHEVLPGHRLDGKRVTELAGEAKDLQGNILYRVVYGEV